jgi:hypothetical protein
LTKLALALMLMFSRLHRLLRRLLSALRSQSETGE